MNQHNHANYPRLLLHWSRLIVKLIAVFFIFHQQLPMTGTLVAIALLVTSETYEFLADYTSQKFPRYQRPVYTAVGIVNIILVFGLLWLTDLLVSDFYLFIFLVVVLAALPGGLPAALNSGLVGAFLYVWVSQDLMPAFNAMLRSIMFLFVGTLAGILGEIVWRTRQQLTTLEEKMYHRQESQNLKEEFLTIAYHNLRTPITVLKGYFEALNQPALEKREREKLWAKFQGSIERIGKQTEHMLEVINLESQDAGLTLEEVNLTQLTQDLVQEFQPQAHEKGITLNAKVPSYSLSISADRGKLRKVFANLVDNAIKYTLNNGKVEVHLHDFETYIRFKVTDTGPGIPEDELKFLFEKLHRVGTLTPRSEGLGLGLYISRLIVERHGGKIDVKSVIGQGTTATVTLPQTTSLGFLEKLA